MKERNRKCEESDPVGAAYMVARMANAPTSSGHCTADRVRQAKTARCTSAPATSSGRKRKTTSSSYRRLRQSRRSPAEGHGTPRRRCRCTRTAPQTYKSQRPAECHRPQSACGGKDRACRHTQSRSSGRAHGTPRRRGRCTRTTRPTGKSPRPLGSARLQSANGGKKKACRRDT